MATSFLSASRRLRLYGDSGPVRFEDYIFGIRFLDITGYVDIGPVFTHIYAVAICWSFMRIMPIGHCDLYVCVSRSTFSAFSSQFLLYIYVGPIYWSTIPLAPIGYGDILLVRFEEYIVGYHYIIPVRGNPKL